MSVVSVESGHDRAWYRFQVRHGTRLLTDFPLIYSHCGKKGQVYVTSCSLLEVFFAYLTGLSSQQTPVLTTVSVEQTLSLFLQRL